MTLQEAITALHSRDDLHVVKAVGSGNAASEGRHCLVWWENTGPEAQERLRQDLEAMGWHFDPWFDSYGNPPRMAFTWAISLYWPGH